jgi:hypothetical protein
VINPGSIPQFTGDLGAIEAAGAALSKLGGTIETRGAHVHSTFQGLAGSYHAPEAQELFDSTKPVQTQAAAFGGNVTSVGGALSQFAHEARPIVQHLQTLKADATSFVNSIKGDDDWTDDGDKVDHNNQLLHDVNAAYVQFLAVEAAAANKIQNLYGGKLFHGGTPSKNDPYAYMTSIPDDVKTPWGNKEEESHWYDKAIHWVDHHLPGWAQPVWDAWAGFEKGFWIDGVWGTVKGLGLLAFDGMMWQTGTHDLMHNVAPGLVDQADGATKNLAYLAADAAIWATPGLGASLTTASKTGALPGPVKDFVDKSNQAGVGFLKGLVAWDEWGKDPARASGAVTFNVLSFLVPGPKGAGAMLKGTAEAGELGVRGLGEAGELGSRGAGEAADLGAHGPTAAELADNLFGGKDVDAALSGAGDLERGAAGLDDLGKVDVPAIGKGDVPTIGEHPPTTDPVPVTEHPAGTDPAPVGEGHDPAPSGGTHDPAAPSGGTHDPAPSGGAHDPAVTDGTPGHAPGHDGSVPHAPGNKEWQYPGLKANDKFGDGAVKGQVGNDLSKAATEMRGGDVIGKEVILREPGTKGAGFAKADHIVLNEDGTIHAVEIKTGDNGLSAAQETHYPRVPEGGIEIGTKQLRPHFEKGHVLEPGEIPEVRLERWDVDTMPGSLRQTLANHTVDDILGGHAGDAARHDLLDWMRQDGNLKIEKVWRYEDGQVKFGDAARGTATDLLDSAKAHVSSGFPDGPVVDPGAGTSPVGVPSHGAVSAGEHPAGPSHLSDGGSAGSAHPVLNDAAPDVHPAGSGEASHGVADAQPAEFSDAGADHAAGGSGGGGAGGGGDLSLGGSGAPHWEQPPNLDGDYRLGPEHINTDRIEALAKDWQQVRYGRLSKEEFLAKWTDPNTGGWRWDQVPADGFAVHEADGQMVPDRYEVELQPGTQIDRFGDAGGQYLSPDGLPYEQRGLPPSNLVPKPGTETVVNDAHPFNYYRYEVVRPFKVDAGGIAPAFEQPGGGIQFLLDSRHLGDVPGVPERLDVAWLVENGYLRPLPSW